MKQQDVPQQPGLLAGNREVTYAVDEKGKYKLEPSTGWEPKDIALRQAWQAIEEEIRAVIKEIKDGGKSPLAYHMLNNQMDIVLLSQYSGIARWRIKRHLKPGVFKKLDKATLDLYSQIFKITSNELAIVPEAPVPPIEIFERNKDDYS